MTSGIDRSISPRLASELGTLLYNHPPKTLSQNLRKMFMDYVVGELKVGASDYSEELVLGLTWLFNFLDVAEEEMNKEKNVCKQSVGATKAPAQATESLEEIISFIVAMVQPERIYSLEYENPVDEEGSNYYDLLIVIPDKAQKSFKHYDVLLDLCCFGNAQVSCSLHQSASLSRQIAEGNLFYSIVCNERNTVYDNGACMLPAPDPARRDRAKEDARKVFAAAYNKALSFLEGAKRYYQTGAQDICAFMLQQSAELTLRGVILAFTGRDVRTHSITELLKCSKRVAPQLNLIFRGRAEDEEQLVCILETSYLNARYQEVYGVNVEALEAVIERVELLLGRAKKLFE